MDLILVVSMLLTLHISGTYTQTNTTTEPKYYEAETTACAGQDYEVGCGDGNGIGIMKFTKLYLELALASRAFGCESGLCNFDIGGGDELGIARNDSIVMSLFNAIRSNCHGKSKCSGTLPTYSDLPVDLPQSAHGGNCGWDDEYISKVHIITECLHASENTIPTLEPYEFDPSLASTTSTTAATVANATTTVTTTATITTKPTASTKDPLLESTTSGKAIKTTNSIVNSGGISAMTEHPGWIALIVFGVIAGIAALVGVGITIYVCCNRQKSVPLKTPLDDKQISTPTEDQPMTVMVVDA